MQLFAYSQFLFPDAAVRPGVLPRNCGHQIVCRGDDYGWHGLRRGPNPFFIWQYTLSGCGEITIGGERHLLPPETAFFVKVPSDHHYFLPRSSPHWEYYFLSVSGEEICRLGDELTARFGCVFRLPRASSCIGAFEEFLRLPADGLMAHPLHASARAYSLIASIFTALEGTRTPPPEQRLLEQVRQYVLAHLEEPLGIGELAGIFHYSRSHFSRLMHVVTGMTAQQYVNSIRLNLAEQLLRTEPLSVKELAARVGFRETSYFCRQFRRQFHLSPRQYLLHSADAR